MKKMIFYPKDGRPGINVTTEADIREYIGEVAESISNVEVKDGLVIGYIGEQGVTLGQLKND